MRARHACLPAYDVRCVKKCNDFVRPVKKCNDLVRSHSIGAPSGAQCPLPHIHYSCMNYSSHVTRHTSHVTRHLQLLGSMIESGLEDEGRWRAHALVIKRHTSHVTRHTSHVTRHTSHVTRHTSHVARHTSHVTRHTSHVTRHTLCRHTAYVVHTFRLAV